jgi:hypothetical protein
MRWVGHEARMEAKGSAYRILWESQKELGLTRRRSVDNIKLDLRERDYGMV